MKRAKQKNGEQWSPEIVVKSVRAVRKDEGDYGGTVGKIYGKCKFWVWTLEWKRDGVMYSETVRESGDDGDDDDELVRER